MIFGATEGAAGDLGPELITDEIGWKWRIGPYTARVTIPDASPTKDIHEYTAMRNDPSFYSGLMDERGIDVLGLTVTPLCYLYYADEETGMRFAALQNDLLAEYCSAKPERFFFMATAPMQSPLAALDETRRAVKLGARGLNVGSGEFGAYDLDAPEYWPLYEFLEQEQIPLFVHPAPLPAATGRTERYNMSWIVGYPYQETYAFTSLALGGVFDAFPGLKVYISHGGGMLPYQLGRIDTARKRKQPGVLAQKPVHEYLEQCYFDILLHDLPARKLLLDTVGAEHLLVGSNFLGWDAMDGFALLDELELSTADDELICYRNAETLFSLNGAAS